MIILTLLGLALIVIGAVAVFKGEFPQLKIYSKKIGAVVLVIGLLLLLIGFVGGNGEVAEPEEEEAETPEIIEVQFNENIAFDNDLISIEGTTNLDDGTLLEYEVENLDNPANNISGDFEVADGSFEEEINIEDFTNGEILVWLAFLPPNQSDDLKEIYGDEGDYITGEKVAYDEELNSNAIIIEERYTKEESITVSGSGDEATDLFFLREGFAIVDFSHAGSSNVIVELKDDSGESIDMLVNKTGIYKGKTAVMAPANGEYLLNVRSDGSWNAEISQKKPAESEIAEVPQTLVGSGDDVNFIYFNEGLKRFEIAHEGAEDFIVRVNQETIVEERGNYEGSSANPINAEGIYLISVIADGSWSISIE